MQCGIDERVRDALAGLGKFAANSHRLHLVSGVQLLRVLQEEKVMLSRSWKRWNAPGLYVACYGPSVAEGSPPLGDGRGMVSPFHRLKLTIPLTPAQLAASEQRCGSDLNGCLSSWCWEMQDVWALPANLELVKP